MTKNTNVVIFLVVCCPSANITSHSTVDSYILLMSIAAPFLSTVYCF